MVLGLEGKGRQELSRHSLRDGDERGEKEGGRRSPRLFRKKKGGDLGAAGET